MRSLLFTVYCLLLTGLASAVPPERWNIQINNPEAHDIDIWRGESLLIQPCFLSYSVPWSISTNASITLYYSTNNFGTIYATDGVVMASDTGRVSVLWSPACDAGALTYKYFVGVSDTGILYRASGQIRMHTSPGWQPVPGPLPRGAAFTNALIYCSYADLQAFSNALASVQQSMVTTETLRAEQAEAAAVIAAVAQAGASAVPTNRTITVNGNTGTLTSNLTFTVQGGGTITNVNGYMSGTITLGASDVGAVSTNDPQYLNALTSIPGLSQVAAVDYILPYGAEISKGTGSLGTYQSAPLSFDYWLSSVAGHYNLYVNSSGILMGGCSDGAPSAILTNTPTLAQVSAAGNVLNLNGGSCLIVPSKTGGASMNSGYIDFQSSAGSTHSYLSSGNGVLAISGNVGSYTNGGRVLCGFNDQYDGSKLHGITAAQVGAVSNSEIFWNGTDGMWARYYSGTAPLLYGMSSGTDGSLLQNITAAQVGAVAINDARYLAALTNAAQFATSAQGIAATNAQALALSQAAGAAAGATALQPTANGSQLTGLTASQVAGVLTNLFVIGGTFAKTNGDGYINDTNDTPLSMFLATSNSFAAQIQSNQMFSGSGIVVQPSSSGATISSTTTNIIPFVFGSGFSLASSNGTTTVVTVDTSAGSAEAAIPSITNAINIISNAIAGPYQPWTTILTPPASGGTTLVTFANGTLPLLVCTGAQVVGVNATSGYGTAGINHFTLALWATNFSITVQSNAYTRWGTPISLSQSRTNHLMFRGNCTNDWTIYQLQ